MKPFVTICPGLWIYFQYFDDTVTEISSSLKKITYLWHTWVATAIFDKNHDEGIRDMKCAVHDMEARALNPVGSNLWCVVLLSKLYLNQKEI